MSALWKIGAAATLAVALWGHGYSTGNMSGREAVASEVRAQIAELEADLADVSTANRAAAAIIEANRIAQATLAQEIEDEALRDPNAFRRVPTDVERLRLERRWGGAR